MAKLDISAAALAGFGVIKRAPLAPAVWGLVRVVLGLGPMLLFMPALFDLFEAMPAIIAKGEPDMHDMAPFMGLNALSPVSMLCGLVAYGLVTGASFRAVLTPEQKAWFYMRFSMAEVMVVVVTIVVAVLAVVAIIPLAIVLAIAGIAGGQANEGVAAILVLLLILAMLVGGVWLALRLSLAPALSFDTKTFQLFESWGHTKGHVLSLLLMAILNVVVVLLIETVFGALFGGLLVGVIFSGGIDLSALQTNPEAFFNRDNLERWMPGLLGIAVVSGILGGYLIAIINAPWAAAYRMLVKDGATEPA